MTKSNGILVCFLLAFAKPAFLQVIAAEHIKADFIENVSASNVRIVSGWDAEPGQHPHHVALRLVSRSGTVSACGGALLHRYWLVTAAHCTVNQVSAVIRAGVTNMTTPEYFSESTRFFNYPMYDVSTPFEVQPDDIALIQMRTPVSFSELTKPIRVQSRADAFRDYSGQMAYTSGFGRTWTDGPSPEVLQWVYLTMVSNEECSRTYGDFITANSICAGPYNVTSQSICRGDSGGPLVHVGEDGIPTLVGITSFVIGGEFGCHSGFPGAFVRLGPFLGWFHEVTGIDFEKMGIEEEITTQEPTYPTTTETMVTSKPELDKSSEEETSSEEKSFEEEDQELQDLLKKLEVEVKVKVRLNKLKKKHEVHHPRRKNSI